jgi:hypothetical protein
MVTLSHDDVPVGLAKRGAPVLTNENIWWLTDRQSRLSSSTAGFPVNSALAFNFSHSAVEARSRCGFSSFFRRIHLRDIELFLSDLAESGRRAQAPPGKDS